MPQPFKVWIPLFLIALAVLFSFTFNSHYEYSDNLWRWLLFFSIGLKNVLVWLREASNHRVSFQTKYTDLGFGVAGLLAPWMNHNYWLVLSIMQGIFLWGAAYDYVKGMMREHSFVIHNCSPALVTDLLVPIAFVILCVLHFWHEVAVVI